MAESDRKEYMRQYNEEHKEHIAEVKRRYYEANKEKFREASRRYYDTHRDIVKARVIVGRDKKAMRSIIETPESPVLTEEIRRRIFGDEGVEQKNGALIETPESPIIKKTNERKADNNIYSKENRNED